MPVDDVDRLELGRHDEWDPLHSRSAGSLCWTTTNAGEAMPGVQTPLSATVWERVATDGFEAAGKAMGVISDRDGIASPAMQLFFGRSAMSVDFLRTVGDRMPGASGEQVVSGLIGYLPEEMKFAPTRRYYLNVIKSYPVAFSRIPSQLVDLSATQDEWWQGLPRLGDLDEEAVRAFLAEALEHHRRATIMQCVAVFNAVQPVHDALERTIEKLEEEDVSVLTAPVGGAEMDVVADIWRASRGQIEVSDIARRHGFHGPLEGEMSSTVWREDEAPLRKLVERYAARAESESPLELGARQQEARERAERELLAASPLGVRPAVRLLLRLGRRRLHLRGVAKRSMLQGFDGIRAGARRLGEILAARGVLDDPDDVFYLTVAELVRPVDPGVKDLVARRRRRRTLYQQVSLPVNFVGEPTPIWPEDAVADPTLPESCRVQGIGVSDGVAEGRIRVVEDPDFVEVEADEILVAPTTDPSWSSIMFISAALIVDIGGPLSHAAVVARELGIPCVVNTGDGTKTLHTGDRVRVDGKAGTIDILERAGDARAG